MVVGLGLRRGRPTMEEVFLASSSSSRSFSPGLEAGYFSGRRDAAAPLLYRGRRDANRSSRARAAEKRPGPKGRTSARPRRRFRPDAARTRTGGARSRSAGTSGRRFVGGNSIDPGRRSRARGRARAIREACRAHARRGRRPGVRANSNDSAGRPAGDDPFGRRLSEIPSAGESLDQSYVFGMWPRAAPRRARARSIRRSSPFSPCQAQFLWCARTTGCRPSTRRRSIGKTAWCRFRGPRSGELWIHCGKFLHAHGVECKSAR